MTVAAWIVVALVVSFVLFLAVNVVVALVRVAAAVERISECVEAQNLYYGLRPEPGVYDEPAYDPTIEEAR